MQNAYIERKGGSIRKELFNTYFFTSLAEVRIMTEELRHDYNHQRPHKSSGYLSPVKYAEQGSDAESKAKQDQLNGDRKPPKIEGRRLAEDREKDHLIIETLITN